MRTRLKEVSGIDWLDGAVMNCLWRGPRLRDILQAAGICGELCGDKGYRGHVDCVCDLVPCEDCPTYGGSIPLARAMLDEGDCILALEVSSLPSQLRISQPQMNGKPLTPAHGYPVRALFPGILGARSVKWLNLITVQTEESANHYQQRDYKILPAAAVDKRAAEPFWRTCPSMLDTPVNSIIGDPADGAVAARDSDGTIAVRGYALPAGLGGPVARVSVSADGGRTWTEAELDHGGLGSVATERGRRRLRWAWCLWRARVAVPAGAGARVVSRAVDWAGNVQPEHCAWNLRGVGYNAWGEARDLTIV
jgi:sulfite oxidase